MPVVSPTQLLDAFGTPRWLQPEPRPASELAKEHRLVFQGPDLTIRSLVPLSLLRKDRCSLTYLGSAAYAPALNGVSGQAVLTQKALADQVPAGNALLLTEEDPRDQFYTLLARLFRGGSYESIQSYVSPSARIHPSASVARNVHVDDDAEIGACAVVLPNTVVGKGVVLKPNCTVGGEGFESAVIDGRRRIVPHPGGVWLDEGSQIGSSTCVDKGLWGDFTRVGAQSMVDNLVHFAHSASCGRGCSIVACAEISGSVRMGDGVWIGPNVTINQGLRIGEHAFIGSAAVVTRDLPAFSLAYGSPAKVMAHVCACRNKLSFAGGEAACARCGKRYRQVDGEVRHAG